MKLRIFSSDAMRVLRVGEFVVITPGHDVPSKEFPSKCFICKEAIKEGDTWRDFFNGEIHVLKHLACEAKS